ncbi:MAG: hypothetical protein ABSE57_24765 [Bryobacteraceae bacterium]|jgi:hypothetical protein
MHTVTLKTALEVKAVVLAAFPAYRKQNAFLSAFGGGLSINSYWDGGSRTEFAVVELSSLQRKSLPTRTHPYFDVAVRGLNNTENADIEVDGVGNVTLKRLPEGFALVAAGTFCGKPATAHVYLNSANMAKLLAA